MQRTNKMIEESKCLGQLTTVASRMQIALMITASSTFTTDNYDYFDFTVCLHI